MKIIFYLSFLFVTVSAYSQTSDSASLLVKYGAKSAELQDLLVFKKIDYFSILVNSPELKGKKFALISKEYWDGKITRTDTIEDFGNSPGPGLPSDSLAITVLSEKMTKDSLRISFTFKSQFKFGLTKKFQTTLSDYYSTRDLSNGESTNIAIGNTFPLLVYTLPYKNPKTPGWLYYYQLTKEGLPPKDWGKKYNIEHYIVFEMIIY